MGNMKYPFAFEIAGDLALFNIPESSPFNVSYPFPTLSAVESWVKNLGYVHGAIPIVQEVRICRPIQTWRYNFLNTGFGRNNANRTKGVADPHLAVCLKNVCYQVSGYFSNTGLRQDSTSPAHFLQCLFERNLRRGRYRVVPYLGWKEFVSSYFGPPRPETTTANVNAVVANMVLRPFSNYSGGEWLGEDNRVPMIEAKNGVVRYDEFSGATSITTP